MKYYRLIDGSRGGFPSFKSNQIYKGDDTRTGTCSVENHAKLSPSYWKQVSKEEYDAQEGVATKPYKSVSKVTYKMITTHPYFKTLPEKELTDIIAHMDFKGYDRLEGIMSHDKARILKAQFEEQSIIPKEFITEEVVDTLPKKWGIKITSESKSALGKWRTDGDWYTSQVGKYCMCPGYQDKQGYCIAKLPAGYTEITFDQFQRLVLKQQPKVKQPKVVEVKKAPERISFYVKYTPEFTEDLYNKLMDWCKINIGGRERGYDDSYEGLIRAEFFLADNYGLNGRQPNNKDIMSYGVDNNRQSCKEEYSVKQVKELINYVEPIKEPVMKATAKTFKITSKSKALLEAMWKELVAIGYDPKHCQNTFTVIGLNMVNPVNKEEFIQLWDDIGAAHSDSQVGKVFNLPEQYNEAIEFATQQLDPKLWKVKTEFKVGDWIIFDGKSHKSGLYQLGEKRESGEFNDTKGQYRNTSDPAYRLATPEEIKEHENNLLLEEAKKRYPKGTKFITASGTGHKLISSGEVMPWNNSDYTGAIADKREGLLYAKGKWAEIVPNTIDIKGYTCEFTSDSVKFGCQTFSKQTALDLVRLMDLGVITSEYSSELKEVGKHFSN